MNKTKELRYYVMLALYFPILLYSVSTFDMDDETYAVKDYRGVAVGEQTVVVGQPYKARTFLTAERLPKKARTAAFSPPSFPRGISLPGATRCWS